jgi:hypothetical protein
MITKKTLHFYVLYIMFKKLHINACNIKKVIRYYKILVDYFILKLYLLR